MKSQRDGDARGADQPSLRDFRRPYSVEDADRERAIIAGEQYAKAKLLVEMGARCPSCNVVFTVAADIVWTGNPSGGTNMAPDENDYEPRHSTCAAQRIQKLMALWKTGGARNFRAVTR